MKDRDNSLVVFRIEVVIVNDSSCNDDAVIKYPNIRITLALDLYVPQSYTPLEQEPDDPDGRSVESSTVDGTWHNDGFPFCRQPYFPTPSVTQREPIVSFLV